MKPASVIDSCRPNSNSSYRAGDTVEAKGVNFPFVTQFGDDKDDSYFVQATVSKHPKGGNVVHSKQNYSVYYAGNTCYGFGRFHYAPKPPWTGGAVYYWNLIDSWYHYVKVSVTRKNTASYAVLVNLGRTRIVIPPRQGICTISGGTYTVEVYVTATGYSATEYPSECINISNETKFQLRELILTLVQMIFPWTPLAILDDSILYKEYKLVDELHDIKFPIGSLTRAYWVVEREVKSDTPSPRDALLYAEDDFFYDGISFQPYAGYWRNVFEEGAFLDAIDHIPRASDNNISNIIEVVSMLKGLIIDHKVEIPERLGDAWLAYRYAYSTTKSDVEDAIKFIGRQADLLSANSFKCFGQYTYTRDDGIEVLSRCSMEITPKELTQVQEIAQKLRQWGLTPNFYVFWDMIPYSFIVDWFIPVGDLLHAEETFRTYKEQYDMTNIYYSLTYDTGPCHVYARWKGEVPSAVIGSSILASKGTSFKTSAFRLLDVASLTIGRF